MSRAGCIWPITRDMRDTYSPETRTAALKVHAVTRIILHLGAQRVDASPGQRQSLSRREQHPRGRDAEDFS